MYGTPNNVRYRTLFVNFPSDEFSEGLKASNDGGLEPLITSHSMNANSLKSVGWE